MGGDHRFLGRPGGFYLVLNPSLEILAASDSYVQAAKNVDIIGRHIFDVFTAHPDMPGAAGLHHLKASLARALRSREVDNLPSEPHETLFDDRRSEVRHWSTSNSPVLGCSGEIVYVVHRDTDVTAEVLAARAAGVSRRETAAALADAQRRLALTLEAGEVGTWLWDVRTDCVVADENVARQFGVTPEEAQGGPMAAYLRAIHPDDRCHVEQQMAEALRTGSSYETEYRLMQPNGSVRSLLARGRVERGADGKPVGLPGVTLDITERVRAEEERRATAAHAEQQARMFDTALSAIADFAYIFNKEGRFIYANKALLGLWGLTLADAMHKNFFELNYPPDLAQKLQRQIQHVFDTGEVVSDETPYTSPTGVDGFYEYILTPVRGANGTVDVVAGSTRVITARKAVELERERLLVEHQLLQAKNEQLLAAERAARAEAERVARMKDEFLATLGHELRTPLNAILGWSQLLRRREHDPARVSEGLTVIERNAVAQKQLIEDLLDMSGIISGKVRLDIQPANLADVIDNAVASVQPTADARAITITTVLSPTLGLVPVDPARLQQVIWNLLSNAIKFTPAGGQIVVTLERTGSQVQVSVRDTGQGIKAEFLRYVFERFRQSDASTTRRHGGLGLGLAIVKTLVEMHGGEVFAESDGEGQGATFFVKFPLSVAAPLPHPPEAHRPVRAVSTRFSSDPQLLAGVKVLVVDDELDGRTLVGRILEECAADVQLAGSAAEALRLFERFAPDVIVSDIGMPDVDGYQLIEQLRGLGGRGRTVPAAALTALARAEDRTRALLAGYQTHIAKPVDPVELIAAVAALAQRTGTPPTPSGQRPNAR